MVQLNWKQYRRFPPNVCGKIKLNYGSSCAIPLLSQTHSVKPHINIDHVIPCTCVTRQVYCDGFYPNGTNPVFADCTAAFSGCLLAANPFYFEGRIMILILCLSP